MKNIFDVKRTTYNLRSVPTVVISKLLNMAWNLYHTEALKHGI